MADGGPPVAVVTALHDELRAILRRSREIHSETWHGLRVWRGRLGGTSVALACTGSGNRNAESGIEALLDRVRPTALIGAGVAGALTADLAAGQIVFGDRMFELSGETAPPAPLWLDRANATNGAIPAVLLTVDRIVCTPEQRRAHSLHLPAGRSAAVDLESAFWARAAERREVPFLALRAISDQADETLPVLLAQCQEPGGPVRSARVAARSFYRPSVARQLLMLHGRVRASSERLARVLEALFAGS